MRGNFYRLSEAEKEQYKKNHCHIAPDLRDGLCMHSTESDIFSLKVLKAVYTNCLHDSKTVAT